MNLLKSATTALLLALTTLVCAAPAAAQTVEYVHTDALGSVVAVTDANRNIVERREYEPYGYQLTPTLQNGPGYTGHVQDASTGLTYMQQRYYDPLLGRFLSVDPVTMHDTGDARHFNRYTYANNSPYSYVDPDGRIPLPVVGGIAGAIISGGISIYRGNSFGTVLKDAVIGGAVGALSTIPGGGAIAVGFRAGLASAAGDFTSQAIDKGVDNVDPGQTLKAGLVGAAIGGLAKAAANKLVPNRAIPGLPSTHQLVREGRALAQSGSEATAGPVRDAVELGTSVVLGGASAGAQTLGSQQASEPLEIEIKDGRCCFRDLN